MKYLCLCYYDQAKFEALSKSELEAVGPACRPHDEALRDSGHLMLVGSLAEAPSSRTLRPGSGRPSVTDGPYAATGEPLGAFFIIEAHDMDDAMEVASKTRARIWADISEAGSRCGRSTCSISRSHGGAAREDGHLGEGEHTGKSARRAGRSHRCLPRAASLGRRRDRDRLHPHARAEVSAAEANLNSERRRDDAIHDDGQGE